MARAVLPVNDTNENQHENTHTSVNHRHTLRLCHAKTNEMLQRSTNNGTLVDSVSKQSRKLSPKIKRDFFGIQYKFLK